MNRAQKILAAVFCALLLGWAYLEFFARPSSFLFIQARGYLALLAQVSAPAVAVLLNIRRPGGKIVGTSLVAALTVFAVIVLDLPRDLMFATGLSLAYAVIIDTASSPSLLALLPGLAGLIAARLSQKGVAEAEPARAGSMKLVQKAAVIFVGAALAASLYLMLAATSRQTVSFHAAYYLLSVGWLAIPAIASGLNIARPSIFTVLASIGVAPLIGLFVFVMCLRLPGAEFLPSFAFNDIFLLHGVAALILAARLPRAVPLLLLSWLCFFVAGSAAVHAATKWALQTQIEQTTAKGGCVFSGAGTKRQVKTADDIHIGWLVGSRSEPVYFVYGAYAHRWSYSRFGLDTREGSPKLYGSTAGMTCN